MTGWAEIKALAGERDKIVMATVGIGAFYSRKTLLVVTAFYELFYNICNSINAISTVGFRILLIIYLFEIIKMLFEYFL